MTRFVAITALWVLTIVLSIGVMMYGWGLTPVSWWWIIGGGVAGRLIILGMEISVKTDG